MMKKVFQQIQLYVILILIPLINTNFINQMQTFMFSERYIYTILSSEHSTVTMQSHNFDE